MTIDHNRTSILLNEIEQTKENIKQLKESEKVIKEYIKTHKIDDDIINKKLLILTSRINQLEKLLIDFYKIINEHSTNIFS